MEETCLICYEDITSEQYVECFACNVSLHTECEYTYRMHNNNNYCKCIHCQRIGTITCTQKNTDYLRVDLLADSTQYTKLDHKQNNEEVFSILPIGTTLHYIEKYFRYNNRKEWRVIDCIISNVDMTNKQITITSRPDENGRIYIGLICYVVGHHFNLTDYYVKN